MKHFPFIEEDQLAQVNFSSKPMVPKGKAITMFHGLIITFRPRQNAANAKVEVGKLEEIVQTGSPGPAVKPTTVKRKRKPGNRS
ncbi:MAG: hypothetical protein IPG38_09255 [Chitinophagaceae bacterium]|nr:hypothetical protein [Chitinophagaceae bacterium]